MSAPNQIPGRVHSPRTPQGPYVSSQESLLSPGAQMSPSYPQSISNTPGGMNQSFQAPNVTVPQSAPPPSYSATAPGSTADQTHFPFDQQSLQIFSTSSSNPMAAERTRPTLPQGNAGVVTSEYVRQELRNRVTRTQQNQQGQHQGSANQMPGHNVQQSLTGQAGQNLQADYDQLALHLDLPTSHGEQQAKSPGLYGMMGLNMPDGNLVAGAGHLAAIPNSPRVFNMEESRQGEKKSLLQQLLSE